MSSIFIFPLYHIINERKNKLKSIPSVKPTIKSTKLSDNRKDYIIENNDYRRGISKENIYRKKFKLTLLSMFENRCAKCGRHDNGIELDHFFLSKNEGGCFIMRHRKGYFVNNAIPLCSTCNRSKSDKSYRKFYSNHELNKLIHKNSAITKILNEKLIQL